MCVCVCVCVCVCLGSMCLKLLWRDDFESLNCWLDPWLSCVLDCIHVCVFLFSKNCFWKLARHLLDIWLSVELPSFFLSQSRLILDSWWIDRESSWTLDSWGIDRASLPVSLLCSLTPPRQLHLLTLFFLTPSSTDGSTPLDTSICRELLRIYIYALRDSVLISSISFALSVPVHLPNTLSFTSNLFLKHSSRLIKFFFTW